MGNAKNRNSFFHITFIFWNIYFKFVVNPILNTTHTKEIKKGEEKNNHTNFQSSSGYFDALTYDNSVFTVSPC